MGKKKKGRVPEALWRLYGNRARTLAETLVSLLPPPPSTAAACGCNGRSCLGCSGADAMSFLLRPHDPSDYHILLNRCFAVLSDNAPPLTVFYPDRRWSQREIVKRTIEILMSDSQMSRNVICNGYNKYTRSSHVVNLLISSAWCLLLRRVGDDAMVHLLKFASIFLLLPHENHHQVAGPSIDNLFPKFSKCVFGSVCQWPLLLPPEPLKKRKRMDVDDYNRDGNDFSQHSLAFDYTLGSFNYCDGSNWKEFIGGECRPPHHKRTKEISFSEGTILSSCIVIDSNKKTLNEEQQCLIKDRECRKRLRPLSWQRRKWRKVITAKENVIASASCITTSTSKEKITSKSRQSCITNLSSLPEKVPAGQESKCFCVSILQASPNFSGGVEIDRKCMFYRTNSFSSLFPKNHMLNSLKPNNAGALSLIKDIFGLSDKDLTAYSVVCSSKHCFCLLGSTCLYHSLLELLTSLIRNCRRCQYLKLLDKHCAVPALTSFAGGEPALHEEYIFPLKKSSGHANELPVKQCSRHAIGSSCPFELSGSYCSKNQVVSFIWSACRSIVPSDFLGSPSNWRILRRNISKFVRLRRFEKFSLKQCTRGLKTSCIPLLSSTHTSCCLGNHVPAKGKVILKESSVFSETKPTLKDKVLPCLIYWLFSHLVVPIIQAHFYVTESEFGKLDTFYYRKTIWERITSRGIVSLREQSHRLLDDKSLQIILRKRSFGFSGVRFCPKENGVRALANLSASSKVPVQRKETADCFKPVNYVLRDVNTVLKGIKMKHPEKLGSSVFDYNDIYKKLAPFIVSLKNGSMTLPSVFVVICDVFKAFDSVDQDKLLSVMKDVMMDDAYDVKQLLQVVCTKNSLWVHCDQTLLGQNISTSTTGSTAGSTPSFPFYSLHSILINQEKSKRIRKVELCRNLYEHLKRNVLRVGQNFYLQEVGIPQGSVLSSLLCSFYYAHLERNTIFPFLEKIQTHHISEPAKGVIPGHSCNDDNAAVKEDLEVGCSKSPNHILLRFVDDFLFISTSKKHAATFFSRLQRGFREYNFSINETKSCINFDMDNISVTLLKKVYTGEDGISFLPWSGLLINMCTLEIQADYTRYLGIHMNSTLSICWLQKPGRHLKAKLCDFLRPKCHPIFYDSNINSGAVVRLNIYQSFLLCAMKFHCYVCDLLSNCKLDAQYYFKTILYSVRYMHKLIKRRMHSTNLGPDVLPILELKKKEVEWLGLNAYIRVLKRKQSRHSTLISLLRSELLKHRMVGRASLKYAVDDSHSSVFWKIKY